MGPKEEEAVKRLPKENPISTPEKIFIDKKLFQYNFKKDKLEEKVVPVLQNYNLNNYKSNKSNYKNILKG